MGSAVNLVKVLQWLNAIIKLVDELELNVCGLKALVSCLHNHADDSCNFRAKRDRITNLDIKRLIMHRLLRFSRFRKLPASEIVASHFKLGNFIASHSEGFILRNLHYSLSHRMAFTLSPSVNFKWNQYWMNERTNNSLLRNNNYEIPLKYIYSPQWCDKTYYSYYTRWNLDIENEFDCRGCAWLRIQNTQISKYIRYYWGVNSIRNVLNMLVYVCCSRMQVKILLNTFKRGNSTSYISNK